jgi:hypothetical protein
LIVTSRVVPPFDTVPLPAAELADPPLSLLISLVPVSPAFAQVVTLPMTTRGVGASAALAIPVAKVRPAAPSTANAIAPERSMFTDLGSARCRAGPCVPAIGSSP